MQQIGDTVRLSPSDLVGHLDCHHLTLLDAAVARGELKRPYFHDALLETLLERGLTHEREYVEHLRSLGRTVVEIPGPGVDRSRADKTIDAMRSGAGVIVQGAFLKDGWAGRTDVLIRVGEASALGAWSYEVVDTKLARRTKGATIVQLCVYSELVAGVQGRMPEYMHVVTPGTGFALETYRTASYGAYFRRVRKGFEEFLNHLDERPTYPEPNEHCDLCIWRLQCDARRRKDDHLCLVAGITKVQIGELRRREIPTTTAFAATPLPLPWKPDRGAVQSYERAREQARIQVEGRAAGRVLYETIPMLADLGLCRLPEPSGGDIFFDLEGDPFIEEGGLEYLFGYAFLEGGAPQYRGEWALTRANEKRVFEAFVDFVMKRWEQFPDLHVYHYAPYEPGALKRLMGRYATREDEIDRMLRGGLFVDLYQVVRHSIRASVERYSIKDLEPLFSFTRGTPLEDAGRALATVQALLETGDPQVVTEELQAVVLGYNREDCLAARGLRDWLEGVRTGLIAKGENIPRPPAKPAEPSEDQSAWKARIDALISALTGGAPDDPRERNSDQQARWILAYILDWHRREEKVVWWEKFRLSALPDEDLLEEKAGLAGLTFVGRVGGTPKAPVDRYRFPPQETEFRGEEQLFSQGGAKFGSVDEILLEERTVDIKKRKDTADAHPTAIFAHNVIGTEVLAEGLVRIGEFVARLGIEGEGRFRAARDLLLRVPPRLGGEPLRIAGETTLQSGMRIAPKITGGVLPIQGPPGTGKTHIGARMICALVKAGKKVGITATSHKVIRNLLDEVIEAAPELGVTVTCIQKLKDPPQDQQHLAFAKTNEELFRALRSRCQVGAGTAWLWAAAEAFEIVDVLFVDEAAQMSLANVLAASHAAPALVLLGDPRQLDQPTQGTHPDGTNVSALEYVLNGRQTIGEEQGLFLGETWRLHPEICAFTSELFYESRLTPLPGLERQEIRSRGRICGTGLRYVPAQHNGNRSSCPEEAEVIRELVAEILGSDTTWINRKGEEEPIRLEDILIIAPYNAQVFELQDRIRGGRIGTVDKFQGQQAPIVIYSMTTSTHADAPRGMNFLYSLNRLNVATSRAQALSILVCSPALFEPECRTPEQMEMANAFCRYLEMAKMA
jgi:predicted RecB family nuclease